MNEVKQKSIEEESTVLEQNMESSSESKKRVLIWIKEHKAQLILAGVSITAIVGYPPHDPPSSKAAEEVRE